MSAGTYVAGSIPINAPTGSALQQKDIVKMCSIFILFNSFLPTHFDLFSLYPIETDPPSEQRSRNPVRISHQASPRTGASSAPVDTIPGALNLSTIQQAAEGQATASLSSSSLSSSPSARGLASFRKHRPRAKSGDMASARMDPTLSPGTPRSRKYSDASDGMGTPKQCP